MKRIIAFLLCISLLSSCSSGITDQTTASTPAADITYETVESTEPKETVTISAEEEKTEELILTPIISDRQTDILECNIIENFCVYDETDFPHKEQLQSIREYIYSAMKKYSPSLWNMYSL